jgi:WD40 repeat protein
MAGQRFESLESLRQATGLARNLKLADEEFLELRNAAIAALALPDLHFGGRRNWWPAGVGTLDFDERHLIYVRPDDNGCSIRRFEDDVELHRLPALGTTRLSNDGKFVAITGVEVEQPKVVRTQVWRIDESIPRRLFTETKARAVNFHRDSQQVALTYVDGSIGLFELPSGRQVSRLAPDTIVRGACCSLHPTNPELAVFSYFGSVVQIRDTRSGSVIASLPVFHPHDVAWHPDGREFAVASTESGLIHLYDRSTLKPIREFKSSYVTSLAFNHAGDRLAASGWGMQIELFDVNSGQLLFATKPMLKSLRFSADDKHLAGAVQDGKLGILQVGEGRECRAINLKNLPQKGEYTSVAVSPDSQILVATTTSGFGFWSLADGRELAFIVMPGENSRVIFEPSGSILTLTRAGVIRWPVVKAIDKTDKLIVGPPDALPLPRGTSLVQSRDGRVTVSCSRAAGLEQDFAGGWILHSDRPGKPIRLDAGADIARIAITPDGRSVITATHAGKPTKFWNAHDGRLVKNLGVERVGHLTISPDGHWLSTGLDGDRLIAINDANLGPSLGGAGTFAPDGNLFASATTEGLIRLVDAATGRELASLESPTQEASFPSIFTADGTRLISVSSFGGIRIWDLRLIRRQLAEMGLDWNAPAYQSCVAETNRVPPSELEVRLGDAGQRPSPPNLKAQQEIDQMCLSLEWAPAKASSCNSRAWILLTAPEALRNVKAGLTMAETAVRLAPDDPTYRNALGLAYYRAGRYRDAIGILRPSLPTQADWVLVLDLYLLAMSHQRLGEVERAKDYFDLAGRWAATQTGLTARDAEDLKMLRAEAEELFKKKP